MSGDIAKKRTIEVVIGFDATEEKIDYIKSDFINEEYGFKDPVGYTAKLIEMGLEWWIREKIGIFCPECDVEMDEGWQYCPKCGWNCDG
jgi:hypothetical protein